MAEICLGNLWLKTYKPFGLEVLEIRYGGIRTRLQSLHERIIFRYNVPRHTLLPPQLNTTDQKLMENWLNEETGIGIVEWATDLHRIWDRSGMNLSLDYARAATPMRALGTG
jgi:hypothetical protein